MRVGNWDLLKGSFQLSGTKKLMRDEGWTCVYDRADVAAERCFSIDVAMAYGTGLLMWSVHIYDITIREISIIKWDEITRASCTRPAVSITFHVYADEQSALPALIQFKPQLVCVKAKKDNELLCGNASLKKA